MRGDDVRTENLFSYLSCEGRVAQDHPLRPIRTLVDETLATTPSARLAVDPAREAAASALAPGFSIRCARSAS
jgi:hypothetical protein